MLTKQGAGYIPVSPIPQQCANCVMSRAGNCDLVMGIIESYAVCMHWEENPGNTTSVAQHLAERGMNVQAGL